jgi:hypothetical protein
VKERKRRGAMTSDVSKISEQSEREEEKGRSETELANQKREAK